MASEGCFLDEGRGAIGKSYAGVWEYYLVVKNYVFVYVFLRIFALAGGSNL